MPLSVISSTRPATLLLVIATAEVLGAAAVCCAAIGGALFAAHCWLPADLHDIF